MYLNAAFLCIEWELPHVHCTRRRKQRSHCPNHESDVPNFHRGERLGIGIPDIAHTATDCHINVYFEVFLVLAVAKHVRTAVTVVFELLLLIVVVVVWLGCSRTGCTAYSYTSALLSVT